MSRKQLRWIVNDGLGVLLQLSRLCCLAPVRFVEVSNDTYIYISRHLLFLSITVFTIVHLYIIYLLHFLIRGTERENYRTLCLALFNAGFLIVIVSYAVLQSEVRIKNYMTCCAKLKRAIRGLPSTEQYNIKKRHVLILFIILTSGITFVPILTAVVLYGSIDLLTAIILLEFTMSVAIQEQFLYFASYVSFVLKYIKQQLEEELSKLISDKDSNQFDNSTTTCFNIPLESINKAIDVIGMCDELFPDITRRKQKSQRIFQINDCYVSVCEGLRELSSSEDFLLFLQLISFSLNLVHFSYDVIRLFYQDGSAPPAMLFLLCLRILVPAIRLIMIVQPCHQTHEMILEIRSLVSEMMCYVTSKHDPVYKVMEEFYNQLISNDTSYTALGMCKIGRPLVTTILGVIITFLIAIYEL